MLTVEQLIGNLLIRHNCVVVPGFGGFVAQRVAAQLDLSNGSMSPAKKSVLFNRQLIANDGLLIQAYAHQAGVNYTQAEVEVNNCIGIWDQALKKGERITIDRVGLLFLDAERNICFEQDRFYNLLLESYGLSSVHFVSAEDVQALNTKINVVSLAEEVESESPIIALNGEPVPVFEAQAEESIVHPKLKKKTPVLRYAAAACILPVLFYSFWIPMKTDVLESGVLKLSDFNPFQQEQKGSYKADKTSYVVNHSSKKAQLKDLPEDVSVYSYELDEDTYIPVKVKDVSGSAAVVLDKAHTTPLELTAPTTSTKKSGFVIVGSYSTIENAQKQVDLMKSLGYNGEILQRDGKIRVSVGSGAQFGTLKTRLAKDGYEAWLLN